MARQQLLPVAHGPDEPPEIDVAQRHIQAHEYRLAAACLLPVLDRPGSTPGAAHAAASLIKGLLTADAPPPTLGDQAQAVRAIELLTALSSRQAEQLERLQAMLDELL